MNQNRPKKWKTVKSQNRLSKAVDRILHKNVWWEWKKMLIFFPWTYCSWSSPSQFILLFVTKNTHWLTTNIYFYVHYKPFMAIKYLNILFINITRYRTSYDREKQNNASTETDGYKRGDNFLHKYHIRLFSLYNVFILCFHSSVGRRGWPNIQGSSEERGVVERWFMMLCWCTY